MKSDDFYDEVFRLLSLTEWRTEALRLIWNKTAEEFFDEHDISKIVQRAPAFRGWFNKSLQISVSTNGIMIRVRPR